MTTSQNVTLSAKDQADIAKIKPMLLDGKSQVEMSVALKLRRETVNRKIQRWVQTSDFEVWLKTAWVEKYQKVDDRTAFDALTKLLGKMVTQKREVTEQVDVREHIKIDMNVLSDDDKSILDRAARLLESKGAKRSSNIH
jgi:hypothetical protein